MSVSVITQAILDAGALSCFCKVNGNLQTHPSWDDETDTPKLMSISLFISGGDDIKIAKAIRNSRPIGIGLNGDFCVDVSGSSIRWYNLNYTDYTNQKKAERLVNRACEKEYLLQRLAELGEDEE